MKNLLKRIILAIIAVPILLVLIIWVPFKSHLILNLVIAALSILGSLEARNLFQKKGPALNIVVTAVIASVFPILSILTVLGLITESWFIPAAASAMGLLFLIEALSRRKETISTVYLRLPAYCFILFFPGLFMSYLIRLSSFSSASIIILIFLTMVFGNDTFAYIFGMAFGGKNRGIFPVSPNKSLAGLIGGVAATGLIGYVYFLAFPDIFINKIYIAIIAGVGIALTSVVGDLLESALKRSAKVKDSGTIMQGRGGVLDTIDSILFSAPLFYYIIFIANG